MGLFGQKKNQEIIGTSVNGLSNNFSSNPVKSATLRNIRNRSSMGSPSKGHEDKSTLGKLLEEENPDINATTAKTFAEKYAKVHTHNSIVMDKNCATCMTGFAPQVLSHLKIACLSYVNQPVSYGTMKLPFSDVLSIKEHLLVKVQKLSD